MILINKCVVLFLTNLAPLIIKIPVLEIDLFHYLFSFLLFFEQVTWIYLEF